MNKQNKIKMCIKRNIWKYFLLSEFKKQKIRKLNLGAGNNSIKNWINADLSPRDRNILYIDVKKKFPFKENSLDYIISEHLIEHLSVKDGKKMLAECFRVLKKGGKIRLSTPDLKFIVSLYNEKKDQKYFIEKITNRFLKELSERKDYRPVFIVNNAFYNWGHKFLYDEELLTEVLKEAGFRNIKRQEYGKSKDKNLDKIEAHQKGVGDLKVCQIESLVLEGTKK